jgi:HSP90 family molecular chaperone
MSSSRPTSGNMHYLSGQAGSKSLWMVSRCSYISFYASLTASADELPLNVSRETLQSTLFLKQIRQVILKHLIALMARLAKDDINKFDSLLSVYGGSLKLGAVEDIKNRDKLTVLTRFSTNQRTSVSFDEVSDHQCLMSQGLLS